jgi:hypothetical protein
LILNGVVIVHGADLIKTERNGRIQGEEKLEKSDESNHPGKDLKCEVCGKPAIGVCSSPLGAISHAFCKECLEKERQPWSTLIGGLYGCSKDNVAEWILPHIKATCEFYNKTECEMWKEVAKLEEEYEDYMRQSYD